MARKPQSSGCRPASNPMCWFISSPFARRQARTTIAPSAEFPQAISNPRPLPRPIYSGKILAGQSRFPSPAQDYEQKTLDLNDRFIANPPATFFFTVKGDSMVGAGIFDGATLIVDRSLKPKSSNIVIADVDGEWMVKRLYKRNGVIKLLSENPLNEPIVLQGRAGTGYLRCGDLCHQRSQIGLSLHWPMPIPSMPPAKKYSGLISEIRL